MDTVTSNLTSFSIVDEKKIRLLIRTLSPPGADDFYRVKIKAKIPKKTSRLLDMAIYDKVFKMVGINKFIGC